MSSVTSPLLEIIYHHTANDALTEAKAPDCSDYRRKECVATAIVFAAFSLEAFFNREYCLHPQVVFKDRTPIEDKWTKLPLALQGAPFDTGREPYESFSELINCVTAHAKPVAEELTLRTPTTPTEILATRSRRNSFSRSWRRLHWPRAP